MKAFKVYQGTKHIDTVYHGDKTTAAEVKRSLVDHDGYSSSIRVVAARATTKRSNPSGGVKVGDIRREDSPGGSVWRVYLGGKVGTGWSVKYGSLTDAESMSRRVTSHRSNPPLATHIARGECRPTAKGRRLLSSRSNPSGEHFVVVPKEGVFHVAAKSMRDALYTRGKGPYPTFSMAKSEVRSLESRKSKERRTNPLQRPAPRNWKGQIREYMTMGMSVTDATSMVASNNAPGNFLAIHSAGEAIRKERQNPSRKKLTRRTRR